MKFEIKLNLFDKITSIENIVNNSYMSVNKGSIYLSMSNYFCNSSFITLLLTNREKSLLRSMEKVNVLSDNCEDIVTDIVRVLNTIHTSWLSYINSLLWINGAIKKLKELNPELGSKPETWLGFDPSPYKLTSNFSFVYLNEKYSPAVCLMIGPNTGLISLLDDEGKNTILSPNEKEEYHPIRIGSILAPVPGPEGELMDNNGTVKSLMVSELLLNWTGDPGAGNFHKTSTPSASAYLTQLLYGDEMSLN